MQTKIAQKEILKKMLFPLLTALFFLILPTILIKYWIIDAYIAQIITLAAVNAIMAISVNIICGFTGQLSLGQASFMAVGAYMSIILTENLGIPMGLSIFLAGICAAIVGFLIGFPTLKLRGDYLAIVTLGFGEIIKVILMNFKTITGGANGKRFTADAAIRFTLNPEISFFVIVMILILIIVFFQNFIRSSYGRAILAVREDEIAANSNGIGIFKYKMTGLIIASFVAGIGGALYAPFIGFIKPEMASFNRSIEYLIFVVLGGMGSITGSIIAAFTLTSLQEFLRFLQDYRLLVYPLILIFVMLYKPEGLMGTREFSFINTQKKFKGFFKKGRLKHEK